MTGRLGFAVRERNCGGRRLRETMRSVSLMRPEQARRPRYACGARSPTPSAGTMTLLPEEPTHVISSELLAGGGFPVFFLHLRGGAVVWRPYRFRRWRAVGTNRKERARIGEIGGQCADS